MSSIETVVHELTPLVYADSVQALGLHPHTDMSHSNRCDRLTLELYGALDNRHIEARRELHMTSGGLWHYVIAHAPDGTEPLETDIITDLNPWQYPGSGRRSGPLHAERQAVQDILAEAGAPEWFVSLRGITTITEAHTKRLTPFVKIAQEAVKLLK